MIRILQGDARDVLKTLPDNSVHCCVSSPPYYGLRDYQVAGQIGLEASPDEYIAQLVAVFREVSRVLRDDGTLWLNLGDSYNAKPSGTRYANAAGFRNGATYTSEASKQAWDTGLGAKQLLMMPARVALALQADGWWLRSDVIWHKPNPMPESVTDRPTSSHEHVFLLAKSQRYFYDADAVREACSELSVQVHGTGYDGDASVHKYVDAFGLKGSLRRNGNNRDLSAGRNIRNVWTIATAPYPDAHFACVDADTEALTPEGWKDHEDLEDGDLIAAYDRPSGRLSWQPATFHRYPFSGDLVAIEKRDASQRLTPNHRCLIRRRTSGEDVTEAKDLKPGMEIPVSALLDVEEGVGPGADLAALIGWYLTEGERRRHHTIRINQSLAANPNKVVAIRGVLNRLGVRYGESVRRREWRGRPSDMIVFSLQGEIVERLYAYSPDKRVALSWLAWPRSDINFLLDAIIDGDGHRRDDGRRCIVQKDRQFIDAIQMLGLRIGINISISARKDGGYIAYLTEGSWLTLRSTNGRHIPLGTVEYNGTVWCPSVSSGFWLARRRGRTFVTGNTFPPELAERCIKAGTSEKGCCANCGAPWVRMTERTAFEPNAAVGSDRKPLHAETYSRHKLSIPGGQSLVGGATRTTGWSPSCQCKVLSGTEAERGEVGTVPCTVLDPFAGAFTAPMVADRLQRNAIGIELSEAYCSMARARLAADAGMFAEIAN